MTVSGRRELSEFVNLPWRIYDGDPNWIAPLKASVRGLLDQRKHPFYAGGQQAEAELFLAWEGRRAVGRVAAIINHAHDRAHGERAGFFGFFECADRPEVARALLDAAEKVFDGASEAEILQQVRDPKVARPSEVDPEVPRDVDEIVLKALENFAGCAVVISHDRWFLDRIATHILAFEGDSEVVWYEGNFDDYEEDKKRRLGDDAVNPHRIKYKRIDA